MPKQELPSIMHPTSSAAKKKTAIEKEATQPNLYGEEDKVFNVLETDVTTIEADIKAKYGKIDKLKAEIETHKIWLKEVKEARDIVAKTRKTAESHK